MRRTRHTLVLSDVHLAEAHPGEGAWMRWLSPEFHPDADVRALVREVLARVGPEDTVELVLDGDVFEFEGPEVEQGEVRFEDHPRTEAAALRTFERIARHHPVFFEALGEFVARGHRIVFVSGNHDVQLFFPAVQHALRRAIAARAPEDVDVEALVEMRPWFYQTDDGIHVEHGHQYDVYCAFRDPLRPLAHWGAEIHPTVGSVGFRHLVTRMGYFNAFDERSYMLTVPQYLVHWARHYMFSPRSLLLTWVAGAVRTVTTVLRSRPARSIEAGMREAARAAREDLARANGVDPEAVEQHARLFAAPIDEDPHRLVREFHLDYVALAALAVSGLFVSPFRPKLGLALVAAAIGLGVAHELVQPRRGLVDEYARVEQVAKRIARLYRARAVIFGHTHQPRGSVEEGVFYANTGAWAPDAPSADEPEGARRDPRGRPIVWLRRDADDRDAPLEGGLHRFRNGALIEERVIVHDEGDRPRPSQLVFVAGAA